MTDLTPEELDEARAEEARCVWGRTDTANRPPPIVIAARLARIGWTPTPKVDPDLLAAREWAANFSPTDAEGYRAGEYDRSSLIRGFLAGIKHGRGS